MAIEQRLFGPKEVSTDQTLEYTVTYPVTIVGIYLSGGAANRTVQLWVRPAIATAILDNQRLLQASPVVATDFSRYGGEINYPLIEGDKVYVQASGAGVNITLVGVDNRV
jgi:hypothetical protein